MVDFYRSRRRSIADHFNNGKFSCYQGRSCKSNTKFTNRINKDYIPFILDQEFLETLEYKICEALKSIDDESIKRCWCQKSINDTRQAGMKAFIGYDGQTVHSLTLKFWSKALSRYARNLDIVQCIAEALPENWFYIDVDKKEVEIQLD